MLPLGRPCGATLPGFSCPGAPARRLRRRRLRGCRLSGVMRTHKTTWVIDYLASLGRKADDQGGENHSLERPAGCLTEIVARKVRDVVWGRSFSNASGLCCRGRGVGYRLSVLGLSVPGSRRRCRVAVAGTEHRQRSTDNLPTHPANRVIPTCAKMHNSSPCLKTFSLSSTSRAIPTG